MRGRAENSTEECLFKVIVDAKTVVRTLPQQGCRVA